MSGSTIQGFNPSRLAPLLRQLRRRHGVSLNALAQATGLSRRTLARIESGHWSPVAGRESRTAMRLAKALLPSERFQEILADATRLSRAIARDPNDPLYKFLDVLYHYPAFLFHDSPVQRALREEFGPDYSHSLPLLLRSGFGTRNLPARLRAFRLQHDLTLVETADLLGLSKSELHRLERAERSPSPRTRYRLLRLLTLPSVAPTLPGEGGPPPVGRPFQGDVSVRVSSGGGKLSGTRAGRRRSLQNRLNRVHPCASVVPSGRQRWLETAKALLSLPPPPPIDVEDDPHCLHRLRRFWLSGDLSTKHLARELGIGQSHLIRLLRGDRRPSRKLRERLQTVLPGTEH